LRVDCSDLTAEQSSELEARARATLLTAELEATVVISCAAGSAEIRVVAGDESVVLKSAISPSTWREQLLDLLDQALTELRARRAPQTSRPDAEAHEIVPAQTTPPRPVEAAWPPSPAAPPAPRARPIARPERRFQPETEVGLRAATELWGAHFALGAGVGGARRVASRWWSGLRVGFFYVSLPNTFSVREGHAIADATFEPRAFAGLRLSLGAGPSVLVVTPRSDLLAKDGTVRIAVRVEAQLSRPFRWGQFQLAPWLGLRLFSAERGVRVSKSSQLAIGGVLPQVGLALAYRQ